MARLYISEQGRDSVYEIFDEEITIGRGAANAVQIGDNHASKHHAAVRQVNGRWKMVDLESKNGTRVNGRFLNQRWLEHGDTVTIGTAVLRFDADGSGGAVASAPVAVTQLPPPPVRVAASAPVTPAVPKPAAVRPAPAAPRPVPVAAAPATASRPAPTAVRRRPREEMDIDEETGRPIRRKGAGTGPILLIGIPAAILGILLFFWLGGSGHLSTNQRVYKDAQELADRGDVAGAVRLAEAQGESGGAHWERLAGAIEGWKRTLTAKTVTASEGEAETAMLAIQKVTRTSEFSPANSLPESRIAVMLREFLAKYSGTMVAAAVMHSEVEPYVTWQRILRENATGSSSPDALLEDVARQARLDASNRRFGDAIAKFQRLIEQQQLSLSAEAFQELKRKTDEKITELEKEARVSFDAAMGEVKKLVAAGDTSGAKAKLAVMISVFGVPGLVREAQAMSDSIK